VQTAFRRPGVPSFVRDNLAAKIKSSGLDLVDTETCFYIDSKSDLTPRQWEVLTWLLSETFEPEGFSTKGSLLQKESATQSTVVEVGPRLSFSTAWSTNAVAICHACGLKDITRVERSTRYLLNNQNVPKESLETFLNEVQDRMTQTQYSEPLSSFETGVSPQPVKLIDILGRGRAALQEINDEMGLAFDDHDLDMYINLFKEELKRNPTNVELFDLAQSNSEHSRHWYFRGRIVIDGVEQPESLMHVVKATLKEDTNSVIAFCDNSSAIRGFEIDTILPTKPGHPSPFEQKKVDYDILFTAETHNFPTGVAPHPGAETGTGGRIRDTHATEEAPSLWLVLHVIVLVTSTYQTTHCHGKTKTSATHPTSPPP